MQTNNSTDLLFAIIFSPKFSKEAATEYIKCNLPTINNIACLYIVALFTAKKFIEKPWNLLWLLRFWNCFLAIFSAFGVWNVVPELWFVIREHGFQASYCKSLHYASHPVAGPWMFLFTVSKLAELGDTLFLVLRKKPVGFLHWFHHSATLVFTFQVYVHIDQFGAARWGTFLNFAVHSFMYSYFLLMTWPNLAKRMPAFLPMLITGLQTTQFVIVNAILIHLGILHVQKGNCDFHAQVFAASLFMFGVYLFCFCQLFAKKYLIKKRQ